MATKYNMLDLMLKEVRQVLYDIDSQDKQLEDIEQQCEMYNIKC